MSDSIRSQWLWVFFHISFQLVPIPKFEPLSSFMPKPPESVPCGQRLMNKLWNLHVLRPKKVFLINLIRKDAAFFFLFFKCHNPYRMTCFDIWVGSMMPFNPFLLKFKSGNSRHLIHTALRKAESNWCERLLTWQLSWRQSLTASSRRRKPQKVSPK